MNIFIWIEWNKNLKTEFHSLGSRLLIQFLTRSFTLLFSFCFCTRFINASHHLKHQCKFRWLFEWLVLSTRRSFFSETLEGSMLTGLLGKILSLHKNYREIELRISRARVFHTLEYLLTFCRCVKAWDELEIPPGRFILHVIETIPRPFDNSIK